MKAVVIILSVGLVLVLAWSCKSKKESIESANSAPIDEDLAILSIKAKSCRGRCKRYDLEASPSGKVGYSGIKNVSNIGTYIGQWNMTEVDALFTENGFSDLADSYLSGAKDIQKFEINYNSKKVLFHKRKAPENLMKLYNSLESMIDSSDWKKVEG